MIEIINLHVEKPYVITLNLQPFRWTETSSKCQRNIIIERMHIILYHRSCADVRSRERQIYNCNPIHCITGMCFLHEHWWDDCVSTDGDFEHWLVLRALMRRRVRTDGDGMKEQWWGMHVSSDGVCMWALMGHACEHWWGMHVSTYGACMWALMGHACMWTLMGHACEHWWACMWALIRNDDVRATMKLANFDGGEGRACDHHLGIYEHLMGRVVQSDEYLSGKSKLFSLMPRQGSYYIRDYPRQAAYLSSSKDSISKVANWLHMHAISGCDSQQSIPTKLSDHWIRGP